MSAIVSSTAMRFSAKADQPVNDSSRIVSHTAGTLIRIAVTTSCLLIFAGCGSGGGGGDNNTTPPPTTNTPTPSSLKFTDITESSGIQYIHGYFNPNGFDVERFSGGVAAGDYDNDGDIDLFIVRGDIGPNRLYRNEGNNQFTDVAQIAGVAYTQSLDKNDRLSGPTFADMDGDTDLDLFIGGFEGAPSFIFANNGDGTFTDVTSGSGIDQMKAVNTVSAALGDYDLDGDLDMVLSHWGQEYESHIDPGDTEHLWRNDSDAAGIRFTSVSIEANIAATAIAPLTPNGVLDGIYDFSFSLTLADINNDGYPDLLMANDFGTTLIFENNRDGTFTDVTEDSAISVISAMGSAVADYDNDGDLDWFITAIFDEATLNANHGNHLYNNDGNGIFSNATQSAGVSEGGWGWGACAADFNNDGLLDFYHTNGWKNLVTATIFDKDPSRLFIANSDGSFSNKAVAAGIVDYEKGRGVVCADFDNDGDVDVFVTHRRVDNSAFLYRNDSIDSHYLSITLRGNGDNTQAVGARIYATVGSVTQTREITIGSNFTSQNPTTQIFGLGSAEQVDTVRIVWPGGVEESHQSVTANQSLQYIQSP
jgi:enediyne biosynthesis protein E4